MQDDIFMNESYHWPKYDHSPDKCLNKVRLYLKDLQETVKRSRGHTLCIQAGGHAGLWPIELAKHYQTVYTFEPEKILFRCIIENLKSHHKGGGEIIVSTKALGPEIKSSVKFKSHPSAGSWRIDESGKHEVEMITIDSLNLPACDAIFLDIEHYEIPALRGALETIRKFQPVLHVEVLKNEEQAMADFMKSINYKHALKVHCDHIYVPEK